MIHGTLHQHHHHHSHHLHQCCNSGEIHRERLYLDEMERIQSHSGVIWNRNRTIEEIRVKVSIFTIPKNILLTRQNLLSRNRRYFNVSTIPAIINDLFRGNMKLFADILSSNSIEITTSFTRIPPVPVSANTEQGCSKSSCFLEWLITVIIEERRR